MSPDLSHKDGTGEQCQEKDEQLELEPSKEALSPISESTFHRIYARAQAGGSGKVTGNVSLDSHAQAAPSSAANRRPVIRAVAATPDGGRFRSAKPVHVAACPYTRVLANTHTRTHVRAQM